MSEEGDGGDARNAAAGWDCNPAVGGRTSSSQQVLYRSTVHYSKSTVPIIILEFTYQASSTTRGAKFSTKFRTKKSYRGAALGRVI
jgi:hypothetical protein